MSNMVPFKPEGGWEEGVKGMFPDILPYPNVIAP
jgi:hypothetical protein